MVGEVIPEFNMVISNFYKQYGRPPSTLYLGAEEWRKLIAHADTYAIDTCDRGRRVMYAGCEVFRVREDSHLRCGL